MAVRETIDLAPGDCVLVRLYEEKRMPGLKGRHYLVSEGEIEAVILPDD